MKNFITLILCILFFPSMGFTQPGKKGQLDNNYFFYDYNGNVKSVCTLLYFNRAQAGDSDRWYLSERDTNKYNKDGFETEESSYASNGKLKLQEIFKLDGRNNITEWKHIDCFRRDTSQQVSISIYKRYFTYKFNSNGNPLEQDVIMDGKFWDKRLKKFDSSGNVTELKIFRDSNTLSETHIYKYNLVGKITEEDVYFDSDTLVKKYFYSYDSIGRKSQFIVNRRDGTLDYRQIIGYDNYDNIINVKRYRSDGILSWDSYDKISEYDKKGNYIKRTTINNGKPMGKIERTIEYY